MEDAFVLRDREAVARLFDAGGVLAAGEGAGDARGADAIARRAAALWDRERTYLAAPRRVIEADDTTLVIAHRATNVLRRAGDGNWRYAISLLDIDERQAP